MMMKRTMGLALLVGWMAGVSPLAEERGAARIPAEVRRVALVIGNSDYRHAPRLPNPVNDAHLIAETLRGLGFELVGGKEMIDLDKASMDKAVQAFGRDVREGSVALFYYAGHGNELGGNNFLLPVDADPFKPSDYLFQTLNAAAVLQQMQDAGTRLNIVILDACRDNPFGGRGTRAAAAGLASMEPPEGTLIAYAAGVGKKAQDGPPGGNSPYTNKLAKAMTHQGWTLWETFNEVGLEVKAYTHDVQTPWISNEPIKGEFCFAGCEATGESDTARRLREAEERIRQLEAGRVVQVPAAPVAPPPKPKQPEADFGIEMVDIPGGEFWMGSPKDEPGREENEGPRHKVRVAAFKLSKTEVTQKQWRAVMGSDPPQLKFKGCDDCPVDSVSFNDIQAFLKKTGDAYRLPTEAEWEYAARAGTDTPFYTGACLGTDQANYDGNYPQPGCPKSGKYLQKTVPVGSYPANPWGLYDMVGNVWEWTADCWHGNYQGAPTDGSAWTTGYCAGRVRRGGSWFTLGGYARSAYRRHYDPGARSGYIGFRLAPGPGASTGR